MCQTDRSDQRMSLFFRLIYFSFIYIHLVAKRNYKLTPEERDWGLTWKVEAWNEFGMKRTVYEKDMDSACKVIMDWWERSEEEFDKMNSLNRAIHQCHEIDKEKGKIFMRV